MPALRHTLRVAPAAQYGNMSGPEALIESRMSRILTKRTLLIKDFTTRSHISKKERAARSRQRQLAGLRERREG